MSGQSSQSVKSLRSVEGHNVHNHPRPCVGGVVFCGDTILLIQRGREPRKGQWSIPGGKIEKGEPIEAALKREIAEETGIRVSVGPLLNVFELIEENGVHYVLIDYLCHAVEKVQPKPGDDAADARFFPFEEALEKVDWHETRRVLEQAIAMRKEQDRS